VESRVKEGEELWWFVDGVQCGKTVGLEPFVLQMEKGEHFVVAVNAVGESASLNVAVR
jgi:membrane carboxypeptidase/penicillin-binding protein PbpC